MMRRRTRSTDKESVKYFHMQTSSSMPRIKVPLVSNLIGFLKSFLVELLGLRHWTSMGWSWRSMRLLDLSTSHDRSGRRSFRGQENLWRLVATKCPKQEAEPIGKGTKVTLVTLLWAKTRILVGSD